MIQVKKDFRKNSKKIIKMFENKNLLQENNESNYSYYNRLNIELMRDFRKLVYTILDVNKTSQINYINIVYLYNDIYESVLQLKINRDNYTFIFKIVETFITYINDSHNMNIDSADFIELNKSNIIYYADMLLNHNCY